MVISSNPEPNKNTFQSLLDKTISTLELEAKNNQEKYLTYLGNKLEKIVTEIMTENSKGTPFENSIELISGQKFPDIIANKFYGVEVKTTIKNHWTSTGNSVLEGTRVDGIERIHMLFGKMINPIEFRCRPYEDCLSEVVVTHSPRYLINMELGEGNTIFDKIDIPYDKLRKSSNPIKSITDYYRKFLKPGEEVWWLEQEEAKSTGLIIRLWNNLSSVEKKKYMIKSMILFPEIFGNKLDKYNKLAVWLVNSESIVCPNVRDVFTAGGQGLIEINGKGIIAPQIVLKMKESIEEIKKMFESIEINTLEKYWGIKVTNPFDNWTQLIENNSNFVRQTGLKNYLK